MSAFSRLYRILRKGTTRGYASVAFSPHNKETVALKTSTFNIFQCL